MKISSKRFCITSLNLIILSILSANMIMNWNNYNGDNWCVQVSIVSVIIIFYQLIVLKIANYKYTDFVPWFVVLSYIFLYGRIIVKAMGHDADVAWHLFAHFEDRRIYQAALFCLMYTQALFSGMMFVRVNKELKNSVMLIKKFEKEEAIYTTNCLSFIGWGVFLLTIPVKLYCNMLTIIAQRVNAGYVISGDYNGVLLALSYTPTVGMIMILCSNKYTKNKMKAIFGVYMLYEVCYMIFSGDRRQEVIGVIALVLCYCKIHKINLSIKRVVEIGLLGIVALTFLAAIRTGRRSVITSFSDYFNLIKVVSQNNLFVETFGEFGGTFFTVVNGVTYYPSTFSYGCGITYIAGLAITIPGIMTKLFPTLFKYGSVGSACYSMNKLPTGGSFAEDMYCNFGFWAIIASVILGYVIARGLRSTNVEQTSKYSLAKYYIIFYVLLNGVRCGFYELTRPLAYAFVLIWIFKTIFLSRVKE